MLSRLCTSMSAAATRGEEYDDALRTALQSVQRVPSSRALTEVLTAMPNVSAQSHVSMLRELARESGQKFDCPGWEYSLGAPRSERIAQTRGQVASIAVHRGSVYWLEEGKLIRAKADGSEPKLLHEIRPAGEDSLGNGDLARLRIAKDTLYWLAGERLFRMPVAGSAAEELGKTSFARELFIEGRSLFVIDGPQILRIALDTLARDVIADGQGQPKHLFVAGGHAYWADWQTEVRRKKLAPGGKVESVARLFQISGFLPTSDGFWIIDRTLRHVHAAQGRVVAEVSTGLWKEGYPVSIGVAGATTIAALPGNGRGWPHTGKIVRLTLAPEPDQESLDVGFASPHHLTVGDGWVYWADASGVFRTATPSAPVAAVGAPPSTTSRRGDVEPSPGPLEDRESLRIMGSIERAGLGKALAAVEPAVRACFGKQKAQWAIKGVISAPGQLASLSVVKPSEGAPEACIRGAMNKGKYPRPAGGGVVIFTWQPPAQ